MAATEDTFASDQNVQHLSLVTVASLQTAVGTFAGR